MKTSVTASTDSNSDSSVDLLHPRHSSSLSLPPAPVPDASTLSGNEHAHLVAVSREAVQSPRVRLFLRAVFRSALMYVLTRFHTAYVQHTYSIP